MIGMKKTEYSDKLERLIRRYFIFLLRYGNFEKAFTIASTVESPDMFTDIYHASKEAGYETLSKLAWEKSNKYTNGLIEQNNRLQIQANLFFSIKSALTAIGDESNVANNDPSDRNRAVEISTAENSDTILENY